MLSVLIYAMDTPSLTTANASHMWVCQVFVQQIDKHTIYAKVSVLVKVLSSRRTVSCNLPSCHRTMENRMQK